MSKARAPLLQDLNYVFMLEMPVYSAMHLGGPATIEVLFSGKDTLSRQHK